MNETQNNPKIPPMETPSTTDKPPAIGKNNKFIAILCFSSGIISCIPLANSLIWHWMYDFPYFLFFEGLSIIPSALIAVATGFGSLIFSRVNQKYWQYLIVGIVLGFTALIYVPMIFSSYREEIRRVTCASELANIGCALRMYACEFKQQFPDRNGAKGLELLRSSGYCENVKMYTCPSVHRDSLQYEHEITEETTDYVYIGGFNESFPMDTPIMYDKDGNHSKGYRNVLFIDGHVGRGSGSNWLDEAKSNKYHNSFFSAWTKK